MPRTPDFEGDVSTCLAHGVAVKSLRMKDLARQQYLASSAAHTCRETHVASAQRGLTGLASRLY